MTGLRNAIYKFGTRKGIDCMITCFEVKLKKIFVKIMKSFYVRNKWQHIYMNIIVFYFPDLYLAICPISSDPFYIVSYYIKWCTTSWTYNIYKYDVFL